MKIAACLVLACFAFPATGLPRVSVDPAGAFVYELVILSKPVKARNLSGVVVDPSGAVVPGATVDLMSYTAGWPYSRPSTKLATTMTNSRGEFSFDRKAFKGPYCLHFSARGFNPLEFAVKLNPFAGKIYARLPIGG